jgi:hypothetical protein
MPESDTVRKGEVIETTVDKVAAADEARAEAQPFLG